MTGQPLRVTIDLDVCILAGECIYNHPDWFAWNDDDHPVVVHGVVSSDAHRQAVEQAMSVCPSGAISMRT